MIYEAINGFDLPKAKATEVGYLRSWPTSAVPLPPITHDELVARMVEDGFPHSFMVDKVTPKSGDILAKFLDGMDTSDLGEWTVVVCDYTVGMTLGQRGFNRCMIVFSRDQRTHVKLAFFNGYSIDAIDQDNLSQY